MRYACLLTGLAFVSCARDTTPPLPRAEQAATAPAVAKDLPLDAEGLTPLHRAAERGDAAAVEQFLKSSVDADLRSRDGITPLMSAMSGAFMDAMRRSMRPKGQEDEWSVEKARQRERETRGQPDPRGPMQFAQVTRFLLAHGADAKVTLRDGSTPLHAAAEVGNAELVLLLLKAGADPNATSRPRGRLSMTPLTIAAGRGEADVVRALLDAGADPAKVPEESRGAFVFQAMSDLEVFRILLDRGLQLPPDALARATAKKPPEIVAEIMRRQRPGDLDAALYSAVKAWRSSVLRPDAEQRLVRTVTTLLDAGASPSSPNGSGEALVRAILRGPPGVARLLQERGAKVDWSRMTDDEHNPSKIAYGSVLENQLDRLKQLEALGMPLDVWGAAVLGRAERLREVVKGHKLADPHGGGDSTALYFAAGYGHEECVRILLDAGADPNERMPSWDTPNIGPRPLDGAAENGHVAVVRLLLERGAKPELMTLDEDERAKLAPAVRELLRIDAQR